MTRNKKIVISVICVILALIILFSVITIQSNSAAVAQTFAPVDFSVSEINYESDYQGDSTANLSGKNNVGNGFRKVAQSDSLELYFKEDFYKEERKTATEYRRYNIAVYDKRTGEIWTAIPDDSVIDFENLPTETISQVQSLVSFTYYDLESDNNKENITNPILQSMGGSEGFEAAGEDISLEDLFGDGAFGEGGDDFSGIDGTAAEDPEANAVTNATVENVPNGIKITYDMPEIAIKFSIYFKLDGDRLDVVIPPDEIVENTEMYEEMQAARDDLTSKVTQLDNYINEIKNSGKLNELDENSRLRLDEQFNNISSNILSLGDQVGGSDYSNHLVSQIESSLTSVFDIVSSLGFEETINNINTTISKIKEDLAKITEQAVCGLVTITPLPYMGAQINGENGYTFYPDGCGGISYYDVEHPDNVSPLIKDIYTNYENDIITYLGYVDEEDTTVREPFTTFSAPVFGMKHNDSAFLAVIAEGDTDARIEYTPASNTANFNEINSTFYVRNTTTTTSSKGESSTVIDPEIINQNRRIRYIFLSDENADYAGMANAYRTHLETYGLISQSDYMNTDKYPLFLEMFMGYKTTGSSVTEEYSETTTFEQAKNIFSDLKSRGVEAINTNMIGWSAATGNYNTFPDYDYKPDGKIGSASDMTDLMNYAKENDISVSLENQYSFGDDASISFTDKDIATTKNYGNFTVSSWDSYLFNNVAVYNKVLDSLKVYQSYNTNALTFKYEGKLVYKDYNSRAPHSRQLSRDIQVSLANKVKQNGIPYVNYRTSNMYMANTADWMLDVMDTDSKYILTDEQVPFMQMVLHGYIPYTPTLANQFNNMYNKTEQTLHYIEYGYMPSYIITNDTPNSVENYTDFLFSTKYSYWADDIESCYNQFKEIFSDLWKVKITDHETLSEGLNCVTYENGTKIYVNYNEKAVTYKGVTVEAQNFKVVG